jgi:chromosome segregation ATPase
VKLTERLGNAKLVGDKRAAAKPSHNRSSDAKLDRAEVDMRAAEDRVETLRAALAQLDEQIATTERELANAKAQRAREVAAGELETLAGAIEQATPNYDAAATALIDAIVKSAVSMSKMTSFVMNVDAVRREVLSAAHFISRTTILQPAPVRATQMKPAHPPSRSHHRLPRSSAKRFTRSIRCSGGKTARYAESGHSRR